MGEARPRDALGDAGREAMEAVEVVMQPLTRILAGPLAMVALVSAAPLVMAVNEDGRAGMASLPQSPATPAVAPALPSGDPTGLLDPLVLGGTEVPSPPTETEGDPTGGSSDVGDPGRPIRPETPPTSEVGTLLKEFDQQRRWQRQALAERTQSALAATTMLSRAERARARAEVLARAAVDREALLASQREARSALMVQLEDLTGERRPHQDLVEAAKERGLEASLARRGGGQD
jgi:hypothetical protein